METENIVLGTLLIIFGTLGTIFNGLFLLSNLISKNFKLEYCWFLYGLASFDFFYSLNVISLQSYNALTDDNLSSSLCQAAGFFLGTLAMGSIFSQALLSLNRYLHMCHLNLYKKCFKRKYCLVMIGLLYLICSCFSAIFFIYDEYSKGIGGLCSLDGYNMPLWHFFVFFTLPVNFAYCISIFCACRISKYIKSHVTNSGRDWKSQIKEAKTIIRFIYIELAIPLALETPGLTVLFAKRYGVPISDVCMSVLIGLFVAHVATDPVVTVLVFKPYRIKIKAILGKFFGQNVTPVVELTSRATSRIPGPESTRDPWKEGDRF